MEYWDLYDKDRNRLNRTVKRGERLKDDEYHIVVNAWLKNKKGEYLISQRSANKKHPLMWECTGGSVLKDEDSMDAAIREVKEELGITIDKEKGTLIGTTTRYYEGCPDILDVYLFECDIPIEEVIYQKEEVCNAKYATVQEILQLVKDQKFEVNAFFEKALELDKNS